MTQGSIAVLGAASFGCPHCSAIAHQDWFTLKADQCDSKHRPYIPPAGIFDRIGTYEVPESTKKEMIDWATRLREGSVFLKPVYSSGSGRDVGNLWISKCYSCQELAVWVHDRIVSPAFPFDIAPNSDLPDDIKADFIEAAKIADLSPRGSAALLRLCVQKLCKYLGKPGKNINDDIAALVSDGLDVRIQKSLDIVRVVGNNAVHPGRIDMNDDKQTASKLFRLVNLISDAMISQPKHIDEFYEEVVPDTAKAQIEKRDKKAPA